MVGINRIDVKDVKRAFLGKKEMHVGKRGLIILTILLFYRLDALKRHKSNQRNKQGCTEESQ